MQKNIKMDAFNFSERRKMFSLFNRKELRGLAKETGVTIGRDKEDTVYNLLCEDPPVVVKIEIIPL